MKNLWHFIANFFNRYFLPNRVLGLIFGGLGCEGLVVLRHFLRVPLESSEKMLWGLPTPRVVILAGLSVFTLAFLLIAILSWLKPPKAEAFIAFASNRPGKVIFASCLTAIVFIGWLIYFFPIERRTPLAEDLGRYRQIILWMILICIQLLVAMIFAWRKYWLPHLIALMKSERALLLAAGLALGILLSLWVGIALTRIGITSDNRYWNEAGVPVLGFQVLLAWTISLGFAAGCLIVKRKTIAEKIVRFFSGWGLDIVICLILWMSAATLWSQSPMDRSYFAPGPYPPNYVYYPYSDAEAHDIGAQYVLIGQGLNNNQYHDKPFYMLFLTVLHILVGQNYLSVVQLQSIILALFPAILYLVGKLIHSRTAGLLIGMFVTFQQTNSIAATLLIQVSQSRLMMTEFPTAFGIALLCLVLVYWLRHPTASSLALLLTGGILGTLILTRTNPLFLVPFVILLIILRYGRFWKSWLSASTLLLAGVMLVVGPWFFANRTPEGRFFIEEKIGAVFSTRYDVSGSTAISDNSISEPQQYPAAPPSETASPQNGGTLQTASSLGSRIQAAFQFAPKHFVHNLVMSVLILPLSHYIGENDYLDVTLKAPYWRQDWQGALPRQKQLFLFLDLIVLSVGIGASWKYAKLAGLVPMIMLIGYYLSNALGRTSGSRYLVPVDWVVLLYFGLGLVHLSIWLAVILGFGHVAKKAPQQRFHPDRKPGRRAGMYLGLALGLLVLGSSVIWIGKFFPMRYPPQTPEELGQAVLERGSLQQSGIAMESITSLMNSKGAVILRGRGLYPRYYAAGQGEPVSRNFMPYSGRDYARLILRVIGQTSKIVILPLANQVDQFPDAADVTVIGCEEVQDVLAHIIIVEGNPDMVILGSPSLPWQCSVEK